MEMELQKEEMKLLIQWHKDDVEQEKRRNKNENLHMIEFE